VAFRAALHSFLLMLYAVCQHGMPKVCWFCSLWCTMHEHIMHGVHPVCVFIHTLCFHLQPHYSLSTTTWLPLRSSQTGKHCMGFMARCRDIIPVCAVSVAQDALLSNKHGVHRTLSQGCLCIGGKPANTYCTHCIYGYVSSNLTFWHHHPHLQCKHDIC
jgi:hypothetical protein